MIIIPPWNDSCGNPVQRWPDVLRVGTCVLLFTPGLDSVLVHQRADNGYWGFLGGAMEVGESLATCIRREVYEESGLALAPEAQFTVTGIYSDPVRYACSQYPDGTTVHYCCITVRHQVTWEQSQHGLRRSPESLALRWVLRGTLPTPFLPGHRQRLADALQSGGSTRLA